MRYIVTNESKINFFDKPIGEYFKNKENIPSSILKIVNIITKYNNIKHVKIILRHYLRNQDIYDKYQISNRYQDDNPYDDLDSISFRMPRYNIVNKKNQYFLSIQEYTALIYGIKYSIDHSILRNPSYNKQICDLIQELFLITHFEYIYKIDIPDYKDINSYFSIMKNINNIYYNYNYNYQKNHDFAITPRELNIISNLILDVYDTNNIVLQINDIISKYCNKAYYDDQYSVVRYNLCLIALCFADKEVIYSLLNIFHYTAITSEYLLNNETNIIHNPQEDDANNIIADFANCLLGRIELHTIKYDALSHNEICQIFKFILDLSAAMNLSVNEDNLLDLSLSLYNSKFNIDISNLINSEVIDISKSELEQIENCHEDLLYIFNEYLELECLKSDEETDDYDDFTEEICFDNREYTLSMDYY